MTVHGLSEDGTNTANIHTQRGRAAKSKTARAGGGTSTKTRAPIGSNTDFVRSDSVSIRNAGYHALANHSQ